MQILVGRKPWLDDWRDVRAVTIKTMKRERERERERKREEKGRRSERIKIKLESAVIK